MVHVERHTKRESSAFLQAPKPQLSQFCRKCGGKISMRRPPSENELRHVCDVCGYIDYYNPKLVRSVRDLPVHAPPTHYALQQRATYAQDTNIRRLTLRRMLMLNWT